ncbi:hypothetical protein Tco_1101587 [Tanacetum coccineum]
MKCYSDDPLVVPIDGLHIGAKLQIVEEPVEIMDREVKRLKQSRFPIVKVRWNSRRGPEFIWERKGPIPRRSIRIFYQSRIFFQCHVAGHNQLSNTPSVILEASTRASTSGSNQRKSTCENTHAELAVASQPSLKRVRRSASTATNTRQSRIIQANGEGVVQLPVEAAPLSIMIKPYRLDMLCRGCNRKGASEASDLDAKTKQEGDQQAHGHPCYIAETFVVDL